MNQTIVVTGGTGFVGSHVVEALVLLGYRVRILDQPTARIDDDDRARLRPLMREAELIWADGRDSTAVDNALRGADAVIHMAPDLGVGLLEVLAARPVQRLVVASSMDVYGEGLYRDVGWRPVLAASRQPERLAHAQWDPVGADGSPLVPVPTPESKPPQRSSLHALWRYEQERVCLAVGAAHRIPTVAVRLFNVYGAGQPMSGPDTGVLARFAASLLDGKSPTVLEDGRQRRDFLNVLDAARACCLALEARAVQATSINIGSGEAHSIASIAIRTARVLGRSIEPTLTGRHRAGDVRHCFADVNLARALLGYAPQVTLDEGIEAMAAWLESRRPDDRDPQRPPTRTIACRL